MFNQQKLIGNFPAFTKLFHENIEYRQRVKEMTRELRSTKEELVNKCM